MKNGIERRRHIRAPLALPVVLKTPQGTIKGRTANISISGLALILLLESPEIDGEFEIIIKLSEEDALPVTCKKVWSGTMVADESVYEAIGVQFTKISSGDRKILASMVSEYYLV